MDRPALSRSPPQLTRPPPRSGGCSLTADATTQCTARTCARPPTTTTCTRQQAQQGRGVAGWVGRGAHGPPARCAALPHSHRGVVPTGRHTLTRPLATHTPRPRCRCPRRAVQKLVQKNTSTHASLLLFRHTPLHHRQLSSSTYCLLASPQSSQPPGREPRHTPSYKTYNKTSQPWPASSTMSGLKRS